MQSQGHVCLQEKVFLQSTAFLISRTNKEGHIVDYGITMSAETDMKARLQRNASNKERAYCVENSTVHFYRLVK